MSRLVNVLSCLSICLAVAPLPARAMDGATISGMSSQSATGESISGASLEIEAPTYYESLVSSASAEVLESSEPGLPTRLWVSDSTASVEYKRRSETKWRLKLRGLSRSHERVDTVYQMIAVLPLPADGFVAKRGGIRPREGTEQASVPLIYGGEKVVLKRNITLERMLLPGLIGNAGDQLPSLAGTGYDYTLWDTIVRYDGSYGETVQVFANVAYTTDDDVSAPDAADERFKAYAMCTCSSLTVYSNVTGSDGGRSR